MARTALTRSAHASGVGRLPSGGCLDHDSVSSPRAGPPRFPRGRHYHKMGRGDDARVPRDRTRPSRMPNRDRMSDFSTRVEQAASAWSTRRCATRTMPMGDAHDDRAYVAGRGAMDGSASSASTSSGAIQFDVCVRYLKENPWERIRLMRERITRTPMSRSRAAKNLLSASTSCPTTSNGLWVERLVANGIRRKRRFDGLNDVDNMVATIASCGEELGARRSAALVVQPVSPCTRTSSTCARRGAWSSAPRSMPIRIKDAGRLLTVDRIRTLVPAVRKVIGKRPARAAQPLHDRHRPARVPRRCEARRRRDAHIDRAARQRRRPAGDADRWRATCAALGYNVNVDDALIDEVGEHFRARGRAGRQAGRACHGIRRVPLRAPDARRHAEQTSSSQLAQAGLARQFAAVLEECARVRNELG